MLRAGDTIDRYTIEGLLGTGGMGQVYKAYDARLQRRLALKLLRLEEAAGTNREEATARMLREARAAAALDHPNTVSIFDVGERDGSMFIAMELVNGRTLRSYIGASVPLDLRVRWLADVARGLAAAHRVGIVHRDVKPENVMVRDDGVIKVLDFGIARGFADDDKPTSDPGLASGVLKNLTKHGMMAGTPAYMAPEQILGHKVSGRSDQFAWGVVAYELIAGFPPWPAGADVKTTLAAIVGENPPPFPKALFLPAALDAAIRRAMSKAADDRFPTMDAIAEILDARDSTGERWRTLDEPISRPTPKSRAEPPPRSLKPRSSMAIGFATAVLLGGGLIVAAVVRAPKNVPAPLAATPSAMQESSTTKPEAARAYHAALLAWRGGSRAVVHDLEGALEIDPTLPEAHLRLGLMTFAWSPSEARQHIREAAKRRDDMAPRDAALLHAAEAYTEGESGRRVFVDRMQAAVAAHPRDAELQYFLGYAIGELVPPELDHAVEAFRHAAEIDPSFVPAIKLAAEYEAYLGHTDVALKSIDQCLASAPHADSCLMVRTLIDEQDGRCDRVESDARAWQKLDPANGASYHVLAGALIAQGRALESARAGLEQAWERVPKTEGKRSRLFDEFALAALAGDFVGAERAARDLDEEVTADADEDAHAKPAGALIEILLERGDVAGAEDVADRYERRRDAWAAPPRAEDFAIARDVTPILELAHARSGKIAPADRVARRRRWIDGWASRGGPVARVYAAVASGLGVDSKIEADALLPELEPVASKSVFAPLMLTDAAIGNVALLAGRMDVALPRLTRAAADCRALSHPIEQTWAVLAFGEAAEKAGDREHACEAYTRVLARWGGAKPASKSAEVARARKKTLACAAK